MRAWFAPLELILGVIFPVPAHMARRRITQRAWAFLEAVEAAAVDARAGHMARRAAQAAVFADH